MASDTDIQAIEQYINETLDVEVHLQPWPDADKLPSYLNQRYEFLRADLLEMPLVWAIDKGAEQQTPATIAKHMKNLEHLRGVSPVFVQYGMSSHNRKRLIQHKVPFLVPGNQLYLPPLGIDLRAHLRRPRSKREGVSPATQLVLLHALNQVPGTRLRPTACARRFGYAAMTMTRAFDEIDRAGVGEQRSVGRRREWRLPTDLRAMWKEILPVLATPVRRVLYIRQRVAISERLWAGYAALAELSGLNPPEIPCIAVAQAEWRRMSPDNQESAVPTGDHDEIAVELWTYDPRQLSRGPTVDRLSLYLSLRDDPDERVQAALDEMIGGIDW